MHQDEADKHCIDSHKKNSFIKQRDYLTLQPFMGTEDCSSLRQDVIVILVFGITGERKCILVTNIGKEPRPLLRPCFRIFYYSSVHFIDLAKNLQEVL